MSTWPRADVWLHGASVGDMRALAPLVAALGARWPGLELLVTAQTRAGRAMARELFGAALPVAAPPLDLPPWPARALGAVRPRVLVLEYLELWPSWLRACARAAVPVVVVDGRVSRRSLRIAPILRKVTGAVSLFCARSARDAEGARRIGVRPERICVHGNGKHDGSSGPAPPSPALRRAVGSVEVVLGSLSRQEEAAALSALAATGLRALIAPRHPSRFGAVERRAKALRVPLRRRSMPRWRGVEPARWVLLDTIGELAAAYELGRVAVVGGTFCRREGQNLVEPAAHGRPIVHGPRVANVQAEADALAGRGAWQVADWPAAMARVAALLQQPGPDPRPALEALRGATARNLAALGPFLTPLGAAPERC